MTTVTSVRLGTDIEQSLEKLSKRRDRSKNYLINQAVKEYVERQAMEEIRWTDTLPALKSVKDGKTIGAADVISWLESWGSNKELAKPE